MKIKNENMDSKWLIDITKPVSDIIQKKYTQPIDMSRAITRMVFESLHKFQSKYKGSKNTDLETMYHLADAYIDSLSQSITITMREYAQDITPIPYITPKKYTEDIKKQFTELLVRDFNNELLLELFITNFLLVHFPAMVNAVKQYKELQKYKEEQKQKTKNKKSEFVNS